MDSANLHSEGNSSPPSLLTACPLQGCLTHSYLHCPLNCTARNPNWVSYSQFSPTRPFWDPRSWTTYFICKATLRATPSLSPHNCHALPQLLCFPCHSPPTRCSLCSVQNKLVKDTSGHSTLPFIILQASLSLRNAKRLSLPAGLAPVDHFSWFGFLYKES